MLNSPRGGVNELASRDGQITALSAEIRCFQAAQAKRRGIESN